MEAASSFRSVAKAQSSQGSSATEVASLDGGAAPQSQAWRRVAIGADVVRHAFLLEQFDHLARQMPPALQERATQSPRQPPAGKPTCLSAFRASPARKSIQGVRSHPIGHGLRIAVGARDQRVESANAFGPGKRVEIIFHAQHGRCVDGRPLEDLPVESAAFGQPEDLGHQPFRRVALQALDRARRQDEHPVGRLAAENLLPGIGDHIELRPIQALRENARSRVANGEALPVRRDPVGVRHPHARCGSVPGKDDVASRNRPWRDRAIGRRRPP